MNFCKLRGEGNLEFKRGEAPLFYILPPHAKILYSYYGEGDKGGEVDNPREMEYTIFNGKGEVYHRNRQQP